MREVFINVLIDRPAGAGIYAKLETGKKCALELPVSGKPEYAIRGFQKNFSSIFGVCYRFHK
jgi:hypothetical protein